MTLQEIRARLPLRLGYIVGRTDVPCPWCDGRSYGGVDRRLLPPEQTVLELAGAPGPSAGSAVSRLWERYLDASEDGLFLPSGPAAVSFASSFRSHGVECDVFYAEMVKIPPFVNAHAALWAEALGRSAAKLLAIHESIRPPGRPPAQRGFDVAHPFGTHSAILQPGFVRGTPVFNDACLCGSEAQAEQWATAADVVDYGNFPFCVFSVFDVVT